MMIMDTHVWFHYIDDGLQNYSDAVHDAVRDQDVLGVSIISCWEIAMLVARGRLRFSIDVGGWINRALKYKGIKLIDLTPDITVMSTRLPGEFHKDPADRIIAASCLTLGVPLITLDQNIRKWGYVRTVS